MQGQNHRPAIDQRVNILGVNVGTQTAEELIQLILSAIKHNQKIIISYVNVQVINIAQKENWFMEFLNQNSVTYCDGYGIKVGAHLIGQYIPERYTPPDWLPQLASACSLNDLRLFFLGSQPGVAEKAAQKLRLQYPGLRIVNTHHGYFDKTPNCQENENIINMINSRHSDILVLGLGSLIQERWLIDNWDLLSCCVAVPVGAAFDYLSGDLRRAPPWMTNHGLEWFGRLLIEPKRLWKRYLLGIPLFLINILKQRLQIFALK